MNAPTYRELKGTSESPPTAPSTLPGTGSGGVHRLGPVLWAGAVYLGLSLIIWSNVWLHHPTTTTTCGCGDSSLFTWFLEWPAYALSHGLNPLYSTAMFHPTGVNLLANTAVLGIGLPLAPITWLFGPVATLNVALTLSPALSAVAMFVLLLRFVTWTPSAFVGGLLYGFSPFILMSLTDSHLMLGMGVVPPLVVLCLDELLIRQRRPPFVVGAALGCLLALQFFIGTEMLTIMAIAGCVGVVLVIVNGTRDPEALRQRARYAATATIAAAMIVVVLLAYPAWFTLAGPAHFTGPIWPHSVIGRGGTQVRNYLLPPARSPLLEGFIHEEGGYQGPFLSDQYFGIGLVAVVIGGMIIWFRDRRLWLFGIIALVSVALSFGLENSFWVPWRVLVKIPLVQNIIPIRVVAVTYFAAAVMLAIIVDHTYLAASRRMPASDPGSTRSGRSVPGAGAFAGAVVALVALAPVASYLAQTIPITAQPIVLPTWFSDVAPHLSAHHVVLTFPSPLTPKQSAMTWQAVNGMQYSMVGGGGPASRVTPPGVESEGQKIVAKVSDLTGPVELTAQEIRQLRQALEAWGTTEVVLPAQSSLPAYEQVGSISSIAAVMSAATGRQPTHEKLAWVWSGRIHGAAPVPTGTRMYDCTVKGGDEPSAITAATACVLSAG
jgi:hypothetical protein